MIFCVRHWCMLYTPYLRPLAVFHLARSWKRVSLTVPVQIYLTVSLIFPRDCKCDNPKSCPFSRTTQTNPLSCVSQRANRTFCLTRDGLVRNFTYRGPQDWNSLSVDVIHRTGKLVDKSNQQKIDVIFDGICFIGLLAFEEPNWSTGGC